MPLTSALSAARLLKHETCDAHVQAESLLAPKLASIRNLDDYARVLKTFYGFFQPLEIRIRHHVTDSVLTDVGQRRNSLLILDDLQAINCSTENIALCEELPLLRTIPQALGAMYVLEGSTLGGRMICKMLLKNPHCDLRENHLRFFSGYGEETGTKWSHFLSAVNSYEEASQEMASSANATFLALTRWMQISL